MENQKRQPFNNLTKDERKAWQKLSERDVIVDVKYYTREAESQLKNKYNYDSNMILTWLKHDSTETRNRLVNDTIERSKKQKMMKETVAEVLKTENLRTPKFYLRPKIHKRGKPGRPVVSSVVTPPAYQNT